MPVTPTYPGIYIEELPSSTHTITAAPTSITVFVGYSNPLQTDLANFGKALQLFSFTDYEREFGGFFTNALFDAESAHFSSLAHAVNQFFLNGGANAYVIGLQAGGGAITVPSVDMNGITFTAKELTDNAHPMVVQIENVQAGMADIIVTYGSGSGARLETYRKVSITSGNPNFIENRMNGISSLVTVKATSGTYPASFTVSNQTLPSATASGAIFNVADFAAVFQTDSQLDKLPIFNLLVIPGVTDPTILSEAIAFCERKQAFLIMDPPSNAVASPLDVNVTPPPPTPRIWIGDYMQGTPPPKSTNAALYFPYIVSGDPLTGQQLYLPPSGTVAGIYARTDINRGVWKAPAGLETTLLNTTGVVELGKMNDVRQGVLNQIAVNCLRSFPNVGTVVFGARTSVGADGNTAFQQWKYIPVRRMALFIEQTLYRNLGWVVFEPNDTPLWVSIRTSIEAFMLTLFHQGAFQGDKPSQAFQVKCDETTTTQTDIDSGKVNIIVAFAPLKPAEFVIVKIAQLAGQTQS